MKTITTLLLLLHSSFCILHSATPPIILDQAAIDNLGIKTEEAKPQAFTKTLFAIGRLQAIPAHKSILSSRIAGHVRSISAHEGDQVEAGQVLLEIESLQPGNPPPRISLTAPLSGIVMQSHTHLGKPVTPETEFFEIVDLSKVYAVANLPEDQAGYTHIGTEATIRIAARPNQTFNGKLIRYGNEADPNSGTIDAYFLLENPNNELRPNMRAEFSVVLDSKQDALSVPKDAVQTDGLKSYIFIEDFDLPNAFVKIPVITGVRNEEHVEITKGLLPGDRIVTSGAYALMFAGEGTISLKEALDAAHGHEHNEDGSEMTAAQRAARAAEKAAAAGVAGGAPTWMVVLLGSLSTLLLILLILSRKTR
ncbi:efflux RND transporter periplasmic adaptor subunit [Pelagicoccus mobilis]|uniref:Efflux RND transporter periplasmic adaptor subunit n=1 Tax=Pelagicoccus mobilis TaxID=415221 RepID=A0A934S2K3_9BACT|nr:efflux RND transporter periplasmic adaptor subunit [Pelagicoccus mobilis]MBK1879929.1 efflux RND transporter periplasmic adaptor subunit [Pelagicoccus mobilis]